MKISRSKIELFCRCKRCFWLDIVKGIKIPPSPAFTLNAAVDHLLKNEMDHYRSNQTIPPIFQNYGLNLVPFQHPKLDEWRKNFEGVRHIHIPTNFEIYGALDDLMVDKKGQVHVVDYKATSKKEDPSLENSWGNSYKRQIEIYQWLLRKNGLPISDTAFFIYANGIKGEHHFDNTLKFNTTLISYTGDTAWVEPTIEDIQICVNGNYLPDPSSDCVHCKFTKNVHEILAMGAKI